MAPASVSDRIVERRTHLAQFCQVDPVKQSLSLVSYYQLARQLYQQTETYAREQDWDNAYIFLAKFTKLCSKVIPTHSDFNKPMYRNERDWIYFQAQSALNVFDVILVGMEDNERKLLEEERQAERRKAVNSPEIEPSVPPLPSVEAALSTSNLSLDERLSSLRLRKDTQDEANSPIDANRHIQQQVAGAEAIKCSVCSASLVAAAKFCMQCGTGVQANTPGSRVSEPAITLDSYLKEVIPDAKTAQQVLATLQIRGEAVNDAKNACLRLHNRLSAAVSKLENHNSDPRDAVVLCVHTLRDCLVFFNYYQAKSLVDRVIQFKQMTDEIGRLNDEVASLCVMLELALPTVATEWRSEWEADKVMQLNIIKALVRDRSVVIKELQGDRNDQIEAMALLRFEFQYPSDRQTDELRALMKTLFKTILQSSHAHAPQVPLWFIPPNDVQYSSRPFASGSFGTIHHGVWGPGTKVVVKALMDGEAGLSQADQDSFRREAELWYKLNHPNVVKMFGACHVSSPPFIVCEDATNGNLADYLAAPHNKDRMWRLLYQASLGLAYLHSCNVVHGDLKLNNILVGEDGQAKVADFGMSFIKRMSKTQSLSLSLSQNASPQSGALRWRAPECFDDKPPTFASDVYSFAMCVVEAATGTPPYWHLDDATAVDFIRNGRIPSQPIEMTDDAWQLIVSMTQRDPVQRVDLVSVIDKLKQLAAEADMARLDSVIICDECYIKLAVGSRFCNRCGHHIEAIDAE